mmetsp:Transcript_90872/g.234630  ORF Transcript_90872/g.234630 Transcript_90872/m.234630 type:complete len:273 (+) Transcript_90872:950-1768(+)
MEVLRVHVDAVGFRSAEAPPQEPIGLHPREASTKKRRTQGRRPGVETFSPDVHPERPGEVDNPVRVRVRAHKRPRGATARLQVAPSLATLEKLRRTDVLVVAANTVDEALIVHDQGRVPNHATTHDVIDPTTLCFRRGGRGRGGRGGRGVRGHGGRDRGHGGGTGRGAGVAAVVVTGAGAHQQPPDEGVTQARDGLGAGLSKRLLIHYHDVRVLVGRIVLAFEAGGETREPGGVHLLPALGTGNQREATVRSSGAGCEHVDGHRGCGDLDVD